VSPFAALAFALAVATSNANAQSLPTATQAMELSGFGGVSGVYTGFFGGKNLGLTAGIDLALPEFKHIRPGIEVRGTYPIDKGTIASERSVLGGLKVNFLLGRRFQPYGDFLFGRGQINYVADNFYQNFDYVLTTGYVYSPGGGFDYQLTDHFRAKVDVQYQRFDSTPTTSGTLYSTQGTVGVVYVFDFNGRRGIH
jgi:hypothetical protein